MKTDINIPSNLVWKFFRLHLTALYNLPAVQIILNQEGFSSMTICPEVQQANTELNSILLLGYELTFTKYNINNTKSIELEVCAAVLMNSAWNLF
jgi:hypothetical protein